MTYTKNRLLIWLVLLTLIPFVSAYDLDQYYLPPESALSVVIATYADQQYNCQGFIAGSDYNIVQATMPLKRASGAVGAFRIELYNATAANIPDKRQTFVGYTDGTNFTLTSSLVYHNFTLPSYAIQSGKEYFLCVWNDQASNYIHMYMNSSGGYTGSGTVYSVNGASWNTGYYANRDLPFGVYKETAAPSIAINSDMVETINYNEPSLVINYNVTAQNLGETTMDCALLNATETLQESANISVSGQHSFTLDTSGIEADYSLSILCDVPSSSYDASSYDIISGSLSAGFLNSTYDSDDDPLVVTQNAGSPGLDFRFNFTGVTAINHIDLEGYSSGSSVLWQIWNFTSGAWDTIRVLPTIASDAYYRFSPFDGDYLNSSKAFVRFYQSAAGNPSKVMSIDHFHIIEESASDQTSQFLYRIDAVFPRVASSFINNTVYTQLDTISFNANFTDPNLYAYNVSFLDANGLPLIGRNYFAENLTSGFAANSTSFILTDLGNFSIRAQVWDSHTAKAIPDYRISSVEGGYLIEDAITITADKPFSLKKNPDRYLFEIDDTDYITFDISSRYPIVYLEDSSVQAHMVILEAGKWVDLQSPRFKIYWVEKTDDGWSFTMQRNGKPGKGKVSFDSIGDLNTIEAEWRYSVISASSAVDLSGIEDAIQGIKGGIEMFGFMILFICLFIGTLVIKDVIARFFFAVGYLGTIYGFAVAGWPVMVYVAIGAFIYNALIFFDT